MGGSGVFPVTLTPLSLGTCSARRNLEYSAAQEVRSRECVPRWLWHLAGGTWFPGWKARPSASEDMEEKGEDGHVACWVPRDAPRWFTPAPRKLSKWPCSEMGSLQSHEGKNGIGGVLESSGWCPSQRQEETQRDREGHLMTEKRLKGRSQTPSTPGATRSCERQEEFSPGPPEGA